MSDPDNLDALRQHKENAQKNVDEACDALAVVDKSAKGVSDTYEMHTTPVMNEFQRRAEEINKQKAQISEMIMVLETAKYNLETAESVHGTAQAMAEHLSMKVDDAKDQA